MTLCDEHLCCIKQQSYLYEHNFIFCRRYSYGSTEFGLLWSNTVGSNDLSHRDMAVYRERITLLFGWNNFVLKGWTGSNVVFCPYYILSIQWAMTGSLSMLTDPLMIPFITGHFFFLIYQISHHQRHIYFRYN